MNGSALDIPEWIQGEGPDSDIVVSTRARLARCLADFPFPSRASREDLSMVVRDVRAACNGLRERFPDLRIISVDKLSPEQKSFLLDARVASVEQIEGGEGRAVVVEPRARLSIMINEEDHLRLQSVLAGLACEEAWEIVDWADDLLSRRLNYGYSRRYGYLTASLSNVGTGLRVSALMHLAGLAISRKLNVQLRAAYDLGVSIRGVFGEGTRSMGDLYQVSNEVTLGVSEKEIVERVRSVVQYMLSEERLARKELLTDRRSRLIEIASRSLKSLKSSMAMRPEQAISLMSALRLAQELGLVENCSRRLLNEALVGMQVSTGSDFGAGIERAGLLRKKLAEVDIIKV